MLRVNRKRPSNGRFLEGLFGRERAQMPHCRRGRDLEVSPDGPQQGGGKGAPSGHWAETRETPLLAKGGVVAHYAYWPVSCVKGKVSNYS